VPPSPSLPAHGVACIIMYCKSDEVRETRCLLLRTCNWKQGWKSQLEPLVPLGGLEIVIYYMYNVPAPQTSDGMMPRAGARRPYPRPTAVPHRWYFVPTASY
jgi:hypothetical protein